jgi:hypothetical protein
VFSQRIANQTMYLGLMENTLTIANQKWFARFQLTGTANTAIICESAGIKTGTVTASDTQTTNVILPNGLTTASSNEYKIETLGAKVKFYINDVLAAEHKTHIPDVYNGMTGGVIILNGTTPASSTTVGIDNFFVNNFDKVDVNIQTSADVVQVKGYPNRVQGNITTQNLVSGSTATVNSAVVIACDSQTQSIGVNIFGTYTSGANGTVFGLVAQASTDGGATWYTLDKFCQVSNGLGTAVAPKLWISNVQSAAQGMYIIKNESFTHVRMCCTAGAVTGTAIVTLNISNATFPADIQYATYAVFSGAANSLSNVTYFAMLGSNKKNIRITNITMGGTNGVTTIGAGTYVHNISRITSITAAGTSLGTLVKFDPNMPTSVLTFGVTTGVCMASTGLTIAGASNLYSISESYFSTVAGAAATGIIVQQRGLPQDGLWIRGSADGISINYTATFNATPPANQQPMVTWQEW